MGKGTVKQLVTAAAAFGLALIGSGCQREQPIVNTEGPANPYAVGSTTLFIHDESRSYDSVGGVDAGIRILITEIWYPVDHAVIEDAPSSYTRATYGDYVFGNSDMHRLMMTKTTFFHLTPETVREGVSQQQIDAAIDELFTRQRGSYVDAPIADGDRLPVIVMTHGDAGSRYNMESACEYLAAHGYFVIAPEHTGNSPYSMTGQDPALAVAGGNPDLRARMAPVLKSLNAHGAYGREEDYGQSYVPLGSGQLDADALTALDKSLLQRVNDLRATLGELDRINAEGPFTGRLDLEKIGLMGRSYGGATTLAGLALEDRFSAGFSVVPPSFPDLRTVLPKEVLASRGHESVLLASDGGFGLGEIEKPTFLLSGAEDALIIGLAAASAAVTGTESPSPANPHPGIRAAYKQTDAPAVWGLLANSNHGSFGVSGPYWWPELKPNVKPRHFDPAQKFELVRPDIAHRIQRQMALEFFNLTIRGDASARQRLLENRFTEQGFTLEARNL